MKFPEKQTTYIVESTISAHVPEPDPDFFPADFNRFRHLPTQFGFVIVTWNPATPDIVREFHWNTEEARRTSISGEVGRIVERKATEREKRDGERQHEADRGAVS